MRWMLVHPGPNFSVADVHNGWAEALRGLGQDVGVYAMDRRLTWFDSAYLPVDEWDGQQVQHVFRKGMTREQAMDAAAEGMLGEVYKMWPHVVVCTSAFFTPPYVLEIMRDRRHKIVMLFTESPYQDDMQLRMAEYADICLLNDPTNLERFKAVCPNSVYMPHAYRPELHHPGDAHPEMVCDLAFVGTGFPSRVRFFEAMNLDGLDVILAGLWNWAGEFEGSPLAKYVAHDPDQCLDNEQTADLYRSARTGMNFYRREAEDDHVGEGWAMGPRELEMAASGLFFLRDPRGEGDEVLHMLPRFDGPEDASDKLRWWLAHDAQRQAVATAARAAIADRTFANHARTLLGMIDR